MLNLQPILENDLVILRPLESVDLQPLYEVASDKLIWIQHPSFDRYQWNIYQQFFKESLASKGALVIIDKITNQIIGSSRFKRIEGVPQAVEIGWSFLSRAYWGGRYNQSFKKLMIDHALKSVDDVIFYIAKANYRSQKAAEKTGAIHIILHKNNVIHPSKDELTYCINRKNWK